MNYIQSLEWRYATKRMTGEKIAPEKLQNILHAIKLAPTSLGLQPIKILIIESDEAKKKVALSCQQPQILESSHILAFCYWTDLEQEKIDSYIQNMADTRGLPVENLAEFKGMIEGYSKDLDSISIQKWAANQAYIALGFGITAAAFEQVDATPMEGYNAQIFDEQFNLASQGLKSTVLLALGKRDTSADFLSTAPKVRRDSKEFFETL